MDLGLAASRVSGSRAMASTGLVWQNLSCLLFYLVVRLVAIS